MLPFQFQFLIGIINPLGGYDPEKDEEEGFNSS